MIEFLYFNGYPEKFYTKEYIINGIRVMKKYLLSSLENQTCKDFKWILMLGDKANITAINYMLDLNYQFEAYIIYNKDINNYITNISKGFDVLVTTRIDYDDMIYYDAVNDVRKVININRPILLHGYNRGFYYIEPIDKYTNFYNNFGNLGTMSIFFKFNYCYKKG